MWIHIWHTYGSVMGFTSTIIQERGIPFWTPASTTEWSGRWGVHCPHGQDPKFQGARLAERVKRASTMEFMRIFLGKTYGKGCSNLILLCLQGWNGGTWINDDKWLILAEAIFQLVSGLLGGTLLRGAWDNTAMKVGNWEGIGWEKRDDTIFDDFRCRDWR